MSDQELLKRVAALEDVGAIQSLKAAYFAACDAKDPAAMRACFVDGPVAIDYGPIGKFNDADAVVKIFTEIGCHPHMVEMHHGSNPRVELLGGDRARGSWALHYQLINTQENKLTQLAGYYEDEYRKVDGAWKIAATHFTPASTLVIDLGPEGVKTVFAGCPPAA